MVYPTGASWKLLSRKDPNSNLIGKRFGMIPRNKHTLCMLNISSYIGGNLIEGGADTTSAFLQTLVLALVNFPDMQARAQEELDSVIGDERSPVLDDIERLPYMQAIIKEVGHHTMMILQTPDLVLPRRTVGGPLPLSPFRTQTSRTLLTRIILSPKGPSSL